MKKIIAAILLTLVLACLFSCGGNDAENENNSGAADTLKGEDGLTPYIGENGNWYIGSVDTGVSANGQNGKDGKSGIDGVTPHVGENGNWFIGDSDTGICAVGKNGENGADGKDGENGKDAQTPHIGENGNWYIGELDTGVKAVGKDGDKGADGVSVINVEVIDGYIYVTYSDAPENPINAGKIKAETPSGANLDFYPLPDGTFGVKAGDLLYSEEIVIPEVYIDKAVTEILPGAFNGAKYLKSVTIPESVTKICEGAFACCPSLLSIFIPDSIECIEQMAFDLDRTSVVCTEIAYPNLFYGSDWCSESTRVISDCISDAEYHEGIAYVTHSTGEATVLGYVGSSYKAVIPEELGSCTVTRVLDYAFAFSPRLLSVTVPKTVKTVGSGSFASDRLREVYDLSGKCSGLSISVYNDLEAPSTLRDTGDGFVFESGKLVDYYGSDKTVALPNSFDGNAYSIAKYAFSNSCAEVLVAADTVMCIAIESYAFSGSGLTAITVPKSVENIYENAFVDCCSLRSVAFSDGTSYRVTDMDFAEIFIPSGPSENAFYIKQNIGKKFTKIA